MCDDIQSLLGILHTTTINPISIWILHRYNAIVNSHIMGWYDRFTICISISCSYKDPINKMLPNKAPIAAS